MSGTDLAALVGNLPEHAVEAVKLLPEDSRFRRIKIPVVKGMPGIHMENSYAGTIGESNGIPVSTKGSSVSHGFGMKSIMAITKKCHGSISINTEDRLFAVSILFPS